MRNPLTLSLLQAIEEPELSVFVEAWDAWEGLLLGIYRQKQVSLADDLAHRTLRKKLLFRYPRYQEALQTHWQIVRKRTAGKGATELVSEDPFLFLLRPEEADAFIRDRAFFFMLPAAREALHSYLLSLRQAKASFQEGR